MPLILARGPGAVKNRRQNASPAHFPAAGTGFASSESWNSRSVIGNIETRNLVQP